MAVKASGRFVPPSAFAAGTGKTFTGAYAWNAPREAVGRERPLTRDERNSAMPGWMRMAKKNHCLRMRLRLTCMVMLLALHELSIFPLSTGKNTVKDR